MTEDSWLIPEDESAILTSVFCLLFSVFWHLNPNDRCPVKYNQPIR